MPVSRLPRFGLLRGRRFLWGFSGRGRDVDGIGMSRGYGRGRVDRLGTLVGV